MTDLHRELEQAAALPPAALAAFLENNIAALFATDGIAAHYRLVREADFPAALGCRPRLIVAWMAFLCGDQANLFRLLEGIAEEALNGAEESSLYYSLKAMVLTMLNPSECLRYGKLSVDILEGEPESFYTASAHLNYAQILAGAKKYRQAAELFAAAAATYQAEGLPFLRLVAFVNEMLNRYRLGELRQVEERCSQALLMHSSFVGGGTAQADIVNLPLGMCQYELGKPGLAIQSLRKAKACIDPMNLFHMHGLVELYLFRCYLVTGDRQGMEDLRSETEAKLGPVAYNPTRLLLSAFSVFCRETFAPHDPDVEALEAAFQTGGAESPAFVLEALMRLQLLGVSHELTIDVLEQRLADLRYTGFLPQVQATELFLAELNHALGNHTEALERMKEAVQHYREAGVCAIFLLLPWRTVGLLAKLEPRLYRLAAKGRAEPASDDLPGMALSAREREILELIAQGKSNDEIGRALYIGVGTIKWHTNNIFSKLGVKNRVQAVEKLRGMKLL